MSADEFAVIRDLFAPLATHEGARGLRDDAAVLEAPGKLVVTTDTIVEGVHFLSGDPIDTIAMKALRVNISDLVGKGAKPTVVLLNLAWPKGRPAVDIAKFANALGRDMRLMGVSLLGGDTTSTPGPLTITITAFGEPLGTRTPSRADAKAGDDVWLVGGEIGSAWLGLQLRTGGVKLAEIQRERDVAEAERNNRAFAGQMPNYLTLPGEEFDADVAWLMSTYLAPFVRIEAAAIVARFAHASMDVSDGLVADAAKLAEASGVALRIEANEVPLAIPAQRWAQTGGDFRKLITGGDDYVVLFTAPSDAREELLAVDTDKSLRLTRIGRVEAGAGAAFLDRSENPILVSDMGYSHQLGR